LGFDFDGIKSFLEVEIDKLLANFVVYNVEHNSIAREHRVDFNGIKNEIFSLMIKEEITMAPSGIIIKCG